MKEAGVEREKARALLRTGRDPSAEKQAAKLRAKLSSDNSFEAIAREWLEVKAHGWTDRQHDNERARLENHAFPWLGKLPIADIGVAEIKPVLSRIVKRGHVDQAHRLQQQKSRIFRYAVATEGAERDPAADLRDTLPAHSQTNLAHITAPVKVGELLRAIDDFSGTFTVTRALKLASLSFARPGEIRGAEWGEMDFEAKVWAIKPLRRKLRKAMKEKPNAPPHIVPLSRQAIAVLRELKAVTGDGRYVFHGARGPSKPILENVHFDAASCPLKPAEIQRPLAITIISGLVVAVPLVLIGGVPALYQCSDRLPQQCAAGLRPEALIGSRPRSTPATTSA